MVNNDTLRVPIPSVKVGNYFLNLTLPSKSSWSNGFNFYYLACTITLYYNFFNWSSGVLKNMHICFLTIKTPNSSVFYWSVAWVSTDRLVFILLRCSSRPLLTDWTGEISLLIWSVIVSFHCYWEGTITSTITARSNHDNSQNYII